MFGYSYRKLLTLTICATLIINAQLPLFAQKYKPYTAVQDNTRVAGSSAHVVKFQIQKFETTKKLQQAYARKQAEEKKTSTNLKTVYKYSEYDKTGYLQAGKWAGKRKDGTSKNTGFFGEIVIQLGPNRGKVVTEASVVIKRNGKEVEVPLLNPYISPANREVIRNGNINAEMIKSAQYWLAQREAQRISPFAQGKEIAEKSKWAYNDLENALKRNFFDIQKEQKHKADIALRIKKGEKNPYFFGKECDEWNNVAKELAKEASIESRAKAVMASNSLLTKADAVKQVKIADDEYEKNKVRIERQTRESIRKKINDAQRLEQARAMFYGGNKNDSKSMLTLGGKTNNANSLVTLGYKPKTGNLTDFNKYNKSISIEEALAYGLISEQEIEGIHNDITNKTVGKNIQNKFDKYIKEESGHNTANLGLWGGVKARFNYFWTQVQNNSIIGKASLWLYAAGEGAVTWKNPSKIYQRTYQQNQNYLDYYNMGTKWSLVDEIALSTGTFASDAGVFKGLGMATGAALPKLTMASSSLAKIALPSLQTGIVLGTYDGINSLGTTLAYKDANKFTATDWNRIGYNMGRGFTSGVIVGQFARVASANPFTSDIAIKTPKSIPAAIKTGATNMAVGMSEGAVFSVSGAAYDQANSLWLPNQDSDKYIGGNPNAFAEMTPATLVKDMVKFYFAIKLPGNIMTPAANNGNKINTKQNLTRKTNITEVAPSRNEAKPTESAALKEVTTTDTSVKYPKNLEFALQAKNGKTLKAVYNTAKGKYKIKDPVAQDKTSSGTLQPTNINTSGRTFNNTLTAQIGEGSGGSGVRASAPSAYAKPTASAKALETTESPFKTFTQKPVFAKAEQKVISAQRVNRAIFKGSLDYLKGNLASGWRSLKTTTGATAFAISMSLANPAFLDAAVSGKVMPIVETLSSSERSTGKALSLLRSAPPVNLAKGYYSDVKTDKAAQPSKEVAYAQEFLRHSEITGQKYFAARPSRLYSMSKYAFAAYLAATSFHFISPTTAPAQEAHPALDETAKDVIYHGYDTNKQDMGYSSILHYANAEINAAIENGTYPSQETLSKIKEAYGDKITAAQLAILHDDNIRKELTFVSSIVSKSLFDRMRALAMPYDVDASLQKTLKMGGAKAINKIISKRERDLNTFSNYFDAIQIKQAKAPHTYFTFDSQASSPTDFTSALKAVITDEDIAITMAKNFIKTKSLKEIVVKKMQGMAPAEKDILLARMIKLGQTMNALEKQGYPKYAVKPVLMGSATEWEDIRTLEPKNLILSVEKDMGDMSAVITNWIEKQNLPDSQDNISKYMPAWIADQLGLSAEAPGIFVQDARTGNYLIYNNNGSARVRFGPHEISPSNTHIHIEKVHTEGIWDGIENNSYYLGIKGDAKINAERARSLFDQKSNSLSDAEKDRRALAMVKSFIPIAESLGDETLVESFKAMPKAENKQQQAVDLLNKMEEISVNKYFLNYLNTLKAQGLVK